MSLVANQENDGQLLTLRMDGNLDPGTLQQVFEALERHLATSLRQVLVLRQGARTDYDIDRGLEFGEKVGALLAGTGVVVAVVKSIEQREDITIDTMIFNRGVSLAQFDNEKDARIWLAGKDG